MPHLQWQTLRTWLNRWKVSFWKHVPADVEYVSADTEHVSDDTEHVSDGTA